MQSPDDGLMNDDTSQQVAAHSSLAYRAQPVLKLGMMLLASGASAFRVKAAMARVAHAVGIEEQQTMVTLNEIVSTSYGDGTFRTEVVEQRSVGVNAANIDRIKQYVDSLPNEVTVEEVEAKLGELSKQKPPYGAVLNALAAGVACAGFSFLNGGELIQLAAVFVAALFGQACRRWLLRRGYNHFGVWLASSIVATSLFIAAVSLMELIFQTTYAHHGGIIAATLFLLPGFPIVTALLEMVRQDFSTAIPRLAYSTALIIAAATALWMVTMTFDWPIANNARADYGLAAEIPLDILASFAGAFGFAVLFVAQPRAALAAASIGAVVNTARIILVDAGYPSQVVLAMAALLIGIIANVVAQRTNFSRISLSVPGVVTMLPGTFLYHALAAVNDGNMNVALQNLGTVFFSLTALGIGLALSRILMDHEWRVDHSPKLPAVWQPPAEKREGPDAP